MAGAAGGLRAGDVVEVRSADEILRTLDANGTFDSLPFMPEMLPFCGKRFRVSKRAYKACDTIEWKQLRRMENAVHLEDLRCDGSAHGGCQAGCLLYWKEAWLKPVDHASAPLTAAPEPSKAPGIPHAVAGLTVDALETTTRAGPSEPGRELFRCQATELLRATTGVIPWWEAGQYLEDLRSRNASPFRVVAGLLIGMFNLFQRVNARVLPGLCVVKGCKTYPFLEGKVSGEIPRETLDLRPGDIVEVKSKEEILDILNEKGETTGLRFDVEMLKYCGQRARVLRRVEQIIDESSGRMLRIKRDCVILENVVCKGVYHRSCPRAIYPYWREAWLRKIAGGESAEVAAPGAVT